MCYGQKIIGYGKAMIKELQEGGRMSEKLIFDYYYGKEAEQFAFYRIPRMLIKDRRFSGLSSDAKILYGLMLDRMALSIRNEWQDGYDRTYIIYTIEQITEDLNCSKDKAVRVLAELDEKKGIGLIEKIRRGLGKPDIIYVKNFIGIERVPDEDDSDEKKSGVDNPGEEKQPANPHKSTEVLKSEFKKSENQNSGSLILSIQESAESDFCNSENQTSRGLKTGLQEVLKSDPIKNNKSNTDMNYTDMNHTDMNHTDYNQNNVGGNNPINLSIGTACADRHGSTDTEKDRLMERIIATRELIKDNICYSDLIVSHSHERARIDELVEIMVDACTSESRTLRIGKEDKPQVLVQSRFEKYDYSMMEYVLSCLSDNTTKVHNIKSYLLTTLYNAPLTMGNYYSAEVNHDMYGSYRA